MSPLWFMKKNHCLIQRLDKQWVHFDSWKNQLFNTGRLDKQWVHFDSLKKTV